ncbi:hypothetical protein HDU93_003578 [Gonapodya sp. JEL0774]|nr:hypothetical protein HDU93_003578 [Gonapodya sp. JEL0774]
MAPGGMGKIRTVSRIAFDKYDKDGNGKMDLTEFKSMCYDLGYYLQDAEVDMAVKMIDASGNGVLEYDEFVKWWSSDGRFKRLHRTPLEEERLAQVSSEFQKLDVKKLGYIDTRNAFPQMYQWLNREGLTKKPLERCQEELDANMDGKISFNEYVNWLVTTGSLVGVQTATN